MKKRILLLLVVLTTLLSSCAAKEGNLDVPQMDLNDYLQYNFDTATYNNTHEYDLIFGIHNYKTEFYHMYNKAIEQGYLTEDLSETQIDSFDSFFAKLEEINQHDLSIFEMDAKELQSLFAANNVELEVMDVFTFKSIKEVFASLQDQTIKITRLDYIETLLTRPLTKEERISFEKYHSLINEIFESASEPLYLGITLDEFKETAKNVIYRDPTDEELAEVEIAYNILEELKKGEND